ncbi:hypothetical protein B0H67DRAFT_644586 [Lasiosphaeris hirsuta]|uniref:Uncharacterized protein n=1 Tax=Lasiosphaeris hirsuta TaxID=260670 RepID=A0AA40AF77_9PEZI|nr:hypothetical protein B0H67DRAFT_644586 [Lasiosphaeris hirsuta]
MWSFVASIKQVVADVLSYQPRFELAAAQAEERERENIRRQLDQLLLVLHGHLLMFCSALDTLASKLQTAEAQHLFLSETTSPEARVLRRQAWETVEEYEDLKNEYWLSFWLTFIDDDASDIEAMPVTMQEVENVIQSGRVRFHQLEDESDARRRECALLTAQIMGKYEVAKDKLSMNDVPPDSPYTSY